MKIIYLSGNSLNNKIWINKVKTEFGVFSEGDILFYDHWENGGKWISLEKENKKLKELVKGQSNYNIFAKSIGTILTLKGIDDGYLKPKKIVFCGVPYQAGLKENLPINEYLKTLTIPVIFIQNEFDPAGSYEDLEEILRNNPPKNYQLVKIPNNSTHDYEDYESLKKITKKFFK